MQTLYTYPDNFRAFKALIAAQYSGANVKVDPKFVFGETNQSKDFLAKFPTGKVGVETPRSQRYSEIPTRITVEFLKKMSIFASFVRCRLSRPTMGPA